MLKNLPNLMSPQLPPNFFAPHHSETSLKNGPYLWLPLCFHVSLIWLRLDFCLHFRHIHNVWYSFLLKFSFCFLTKHPPGFLLPPRPLSISGASSTLRCSSSKFWMPQESTLGPFLFPLDTSALRNLIYSSHDFTYKLMNLKFTHPVLNFPVTNISSSG